MRVLPLVVCLSVPFVAAAEEPLAVGPSNAPAIGIEELVRMSECRLLELYRGAEPGPIPSGYVPGRMISKPGRPMTVPMSRFVRHTLWQGKNFDGNGIMTNRMFGVRFIKGEIQQGDSWIDGRPSNLIDYHETSLLFRPYRDEFREVSPGIYLGIMFKRACPPKVVTYFALDARSGSCRCWQAK